MKNDLKKVRIDRWLSAARFYKTRSKAAAACKGGKIRINGSRAKSHKFISIGNSITIQLHGNYRNITVMGLAERGLPVKKAQKLYNEKKNQKISENEMELIKLFKNSYKKIKHKYKGRPTKKERREMDRFRDEMFNN